MERRCALAPQMPHENRTTVGVWVFALALGAFNVILLAYTVGHSDLTLVDFSTFFVAGKLLNAGMGHRLYDLAAQAQMQLNARFRLVPLPYNHTPMEAALFCPLALLPYRAGYCVWNLINVALLAGMAWRLRPWLTSLGNVSAPLVFALSLAYWPNMMVLFKGQDSIVMAMVMTEAYVQSKQGRDGRAGMILALGLIKFHLVLPLIVCFAMNRQWKLVKGFAVAGCGVAAVSLAITGVGGVRQYFNLLTSLNRMPLAIFTRPEQMPSLRGLIATWLQATPGRIGISIAAASALVFLAVWRSLPGSDRTERFDLFFACATAASYAVSFNAYEHDMALIFPGLLLAANAAMKVESTGWRLACLGLVASLFCTPLYLYFFSHDMLCRMCLPLIALILVLPMAARSVGAEALRT